MPEPISIVVKPDFFKQLIHYGVFGILRNSIGYAIYLFITFRGIEPKVAVTLLYLFGAVVGFIGNRRYIFRHEGSWLLSGARYLTAHFLGYLINLGLLLFLVDHIGYPHQLAQIVAIFVVALFLFVAFRYFVFPKTAQEKGIRE